MINGRISSKQVKIYGIIISAVVTITVAVIRSCSNSDKNNITLNNNVSINLDTVRKKNNENPDKAIADNKEVDSSSIHHFFPPKQNPRTDKKNTSLSSNAVNKRILIQETASTLDEYLNKLSDPLIDYNKKNGLVTGVKKFFAPKAIVECNGLSDGNKDIDSYIESLRILNTTILTHEEVRNEEKLIIKMIVHEKVN